MLYMFLADGFEEIEAITTLDIIRRAGIDIVTVGVTASKITGSHNIPVTADKKIDSISKDECSGIILPGGMPGTVNLENCEKVRDYILYSAEKKLLIGAICAAPSILGHLGVLEGKKATCFPGFEKDLIGAEHLDESVVIDDNIITAKGAGVAADFGFGIVEKLLGCRESDRLKETMQCRK